MSGHGFTSAFATELDAYLAFKATMGFTGASRIWYLKQFDAYCAEHDRTVFDKDTVEGWVSVQLHRCGRYRSWMSYIRDVGRWMTMNRIPEAYVLSDRWKAPFVAAHPYLLSRREIEPLRSGRFPRLRTSPSRQDGTAAVSSFDHFGSLVGGAGEWRTAAARAPHTEAAEAPDSTAPPTPGAWPTRHRLGASRSLAQDQSHGPLPAGYPAADHHAPPRPRKRFYHSSVLRLCNPGHDAASDQRRHPRHQHRGHRTPHRRPTPNPLQSAITAIR
jgi:hypothetical protein